MRAVHLETRRNALNAALPTSKVTTFIFAWAPSQPIAESPPSQERHRSLIRVTMKNLSFHRSAPDRAFDDVYGDQCAHLFYECSVYDPSGDWLANSLELPSPLVRLEQIVQLDDVQERRRSRHGIKLGKCPQGIGAQAQELDSGQGTHRSLRLLVRYDHAQKQNSDLTTMALRPRATKRARPQTSPTAKDVNNHDHLSLYFRHLDAPCLVDNQVQNDDQPRRKRPMVSANLRFLEKMPPLRDYQRGRFGRRGGVDGGDGGSSQWMRALEESMEETSFVTREAPTYAAMVAPVPIPVDSRRDNNYIPVPLASLPSTSRFNSADEDAIRRRRLFALQAARGGGKDDEARPATEGLAL